MSVELDDRMARMALNCVTEGGSAELSRVVARFSPAEIWAGLLRGTSVSSWAKRAQSLNLEHVVDKAARHEIRFVIPGDDEWPEGLAALDRCEPVNAMGGVPLGVWVRGEARLDDLLASSVSVVGSRAASPYGEAVATDLAAGVSLAGRTVVSGGAYGIDAAAHRGALAVERATIAVMAGGLDKPYPPGNAGLLEQVRQSGALVSELAPAEHPTRMRFLSRNRLIAAMTPGTVIVEAAARSGARNTVTWANSCGRVVMAVPGPVTSATSHTPHRLLQDHEAILVTGAEDVCKLLDPLSPAALQRKGPQRPLDLLNGDELAVFEAIPGRGCLSAGELSLRSGVPLGTCFSVLSDLAGRGLITETPNGDWRLPPREGNSRSTNGNPP